MHRYSQFWKNWTLLVDFPPFCLEGDNFWDFQFAFLLSFLGEATPSISINGSTLKGKRFLPTEANCFHLGIDLAPDYVVLLT